MSKTNVYRDGFVHVQAKQCATCIFRPGNKMLLAPGRVESMVAGATANNGCIPCHDTLDTGAENVCRGFFDKHQTPTLQLAQRMGRVRFVKVKRKP